MGLKIAGDISPDKFVQFFYCILEFAAAPGRAFPDHGNSPTFFLHLAQHALITLLIICKLFLPFIGIISIGIGQFATIMLVPVATMNKYGHLMTAQYNVRLYFADLAIKPEPIT